MPLVCMPWGPIEKPSVAMGILKRLIAASGCTPELHYMNVMLSQQMGLQAYEELASTAFFHQEWFSHSCCSGLQVQARCAIVGTIYTPPLTQKCYEGGSLATHP